MASVASSAKRRPRPPPAVGLAIRIHLWAIADELSVLCDLYVADWYNPVLGHMQYSLRDERRDSSKGRIWRVTWKDRPLDTPVRIVGAPVEELLDLLKAYEDRNRYRARRALWPAAVKTASY